jgi:protocatechuate 3,4-dioxygenase beta subunit
VQRSAVEIHPSANCNTSARTRERSQAHYGRVDDGSAFPNKSRTNILRYQTGTPVPTQTVRTTIDDQIQEFILLSDVLGLSLLVDSIDHPKPKGSTEGTVLGPFHTHEAKHSGQGSLISQDPDGESLLVLCTLKDTDGYPISGAEIDVWETDSKGFYDVQYAERTGPDGRAVLTSDENGEFWFKAIVPVPYPIPHDGPVGKLLKMLDRHPYRPSHMHFMFKKAGYDPLVT